MSATVPPSGLPRASRPDAPIRPIRAAGLGCGMASWDDVRRIAETKMPDLNANTVEEAIRIIEGTARSMGIEVS